MMQRLGDKILTRHAPSSFVPTPASRTSFARLMSSVGLMGKVLAANMAASSTSPLIKQRTAALRDDASLVGGARMALRPSSAAVSDTSIADGT